MVVIVYWIGLPYYLQYKNGYLLTGKFCLFNTMASCFMSKLVSAVLICLGHWLLVNVVFHFLMALTTSPGRPPTDKVLEQVSSICKKCISPKPIRTHHCRSVNQCVHIA